jgi:hypothetical protein
MESSLIKASTSSDDELIAQLAYITILVSRYGILVLVILGIVGNALNVIIFCQPKLRSSPCTLYLCTGACIDFILTVTIALPRMLTTYNLDYSAIIGILCKMRHFTYYNLSSLSVWMVALATFDRFLISSPLATRRQMSSFRNTYRFIAGSSILLTLIFGDLFYCADVVANGVITSCSASTSKQCGFYNQIARLLTVLFIPETVILVFSIGIIRNLKSLKVVPTATSRSESQQYRIRKTDRDLIKVRIFILQLCELDAV